MANKIIKELTIQRGEDNFVINSTILPTEDKLSVASNGDWVELFDKKISSYMELDESKISVDYMAEAEASTVLPLITPINDANFSSERFKIAGLSLYLRDIVDRKIEIIGIKNKKPFLSDLSVNTADSGYDTAEIFVIATISAMDKMSPTSTKIDVELSNTASNPNVVYSDTTYLKDGYLDYCLDEYCLGYRDVNGSVMGYMAISTSQQEEGFYPQPFKIAHVTFSGSLDDSIPSGGILPPSSFLVPAFTLNKGEEYTNAEVLQFADSISGDIENEIDVINAKIDYINDVRLPHMDGTELVIASIDYVDEEIGTVMGYLDDKQDILIAGDGISIDADGKTISVTGSDIASTSYKDAAVVLITGSSLTAGQFQNAGGAWVDRVNDTTDFNIVNNAEGGEGLTQNITRIANDELNWDAGNSITNLKPKYIMWNNMANSTPTDQTSFNNEMNNAKFVTESYGAKMLLGSEEDWHKNADFLYTQLYNSFAKEHNIPFSSIQETWRKCFPLNSPYKGWGEADNHAGYRAQSPYFQHADMIRQLPVEKNVKMFRTRPYVGSAVGSLTYTTLDERIEKWHSIAAGVDTIWGFSSGSVDVGYNSGGGTYGSANSPDVDNDKSGVMGVSETSKMQRGEAIEFTNVALIEFILDKTNITSGTFSVETTSTVNVYVAVNKGSAMTWEEVTFVDGKAVIDGTLFDGTIQLYDKVKILVTSNGDFTLAKPEFSNYNGIDKVIETPTLDLERKFGKELNTVHSMETGWVIPAGELTQVQSLPPLIANYTSYNDIKSHLALYRSYDTASKKIVFDGSKRKVAVRVVATTWKPIQNTNAAYSGGDYPLFVVNTRNLNNYDYDYNTIRISFDGQNYRTINVLPGWSEQYFEVDLGGVSEVTVKVEYGNSYGDTIFIHDLSIQEIDSQGSGGGSGTELPVNDKYSVLNEGEFIDLFEKVPNVPAVSKQVFELMGTTTTLSAPDASVYGFTAPAVSAYSRPTDEEIDAYYAENLANMRLDSIEYYVKAGSTGNTFYITDTNLVSDGYEIASIVLDGSLAEGTKVVAKLDGTDDRVTINSDCPYYINGEFILPNERNIIGMGGSSDAFAYKEYINDGISGSTERWDFMNLSTGTKGATAAINIKMSLNVSRDEVLGGYVVPKVEELDNANLKTVNGQSLIKTDTETNISISGGTMAIDTSGDISNMQNDTAYLVTIAEDTDLSTLSIENQTGIITTSELWLDASNDSTVTYPSTIVWEGTPVTSLTANTAYRFSVRDDLGTTVIKLNYSYVGTPTNPNKVCLPDGTINLENRENVIGGPCLVDGTSAFRYKSAVTNISGNWTNLTNATSMFYGTGARTDTSTYPSLTNMTSMYEQVSQIEIDKIDESNFPKVTKCDKAFKYGGELTSFAQHVNPSVVSLPEVTSAFEMFDGAIKFNTHPDNIHVPLLENANGMFGNTFGWDATSGTLKFPKVTNCSYMFYLKTPNSDDEYPLFNPDKIELNSVTTLGSNMFRARIHMKKTKIFAPNLQNTTNSTFSHDSRNNKVDLDREALDYFIANIPDYSTTGGVHILYIGGMTHAAAVTDAANAKGWTVEDIVRTI